jgi:hypothetical protein
MPYWVKRILLKTGERVTERELGRDENLFDGPTPVVGDRLIVTCRGRTFEAKVVWGNSSTSDPKELVPLRVEEI